MKKVFALFLFLVAFSISHAQTNDEGEIFYEQVIALSFDKSKMPPEAAQWIDAMPKEIRDQKQLVFNSNGSVYKNYEDPDAVVEEGDRMAMMMRRNMPDDFTAINLKDKTYADQKEIFGRMFLIKDNLKDYQWKMTGAQEEVAGHHCMVATTMDPEDSTEIVAWFSPSIPVPSGPGSISNLPGMVLKMELAGGALNRGRRGASNNTLTITATEINFRKVKKSEMKGPEKGKEVNREEFQAMVKEKMEEMREQFKNGKRGGGMRVH